MKSQINNVLNVIRNNENEMVKVGEINQTNATQPKETFTAAQLWNIQKQRRSRYSYSTRIAC